MRFHPSSARVSASIGVAVSDLLSQPRPDLLFDMADSALYHAKSNGKGKALMWGGPTETVGA
ncbi:GGDEF domain-containing protein [Paracoccus sp. PS-1]|nr:GGDEF domain-containing protein [Paracoccus sp. PS1]MDQ7264014.1 GGDEF domain-containing protein [Paracoccus sp. PS1]